MMGHIVLGQAGKIRHSRRIARIKRRLGKWDGGDVITVVAGIVQSHNPVNEGSRAWAKNLLLDR